LEIDDFEGGGLSVSANFSRIVGDVPANHFCTLVNAFVADSFHTKKLCSRLSSSEVQF